MPARWIVRGGEGRAKRAWKWSRRGRREAVFREVGVREGVILIEREVHLHGRGPHLVTT